MIFRVLSVSDRPPDRARECAYLIAEDMDDFGKYKTQYRMIVCDESGESHPIGRVKIGQFGWSDGQVEPRLPQEFTTLAPEFFSLGQDDSYYENLKNLGQVVREAVLIAMQDIAKDPVLYEIARRETVTGESLLRSVRGATAQNQFRRLAEGGDRLTPYEFKYTCPEPPKQDGRATLPVTIEFKVLPDSSPPTNVHVLIGQNGVGKTQILEWIAHALSDGASNCGTLMQTGSSGKEDYFAGLVSVTFSAFDPFDPLPDRRGEVGGLRYNYLGLKSTSRGQAPGTLKNLKQLCGNFTDSFVGCVAGPKAERWRDAMRMLEADPSFGEHGVSSLLEQSVEVDLAGDRCEEVVSVLAEEAGKLFLRLSTGHKIVLLTMTKLVETVEDRTLVLFDEPESHLHPPLLSAFIRALSQLLIDRNGVAIVATHSPMVLQEVPRCCVWKLRRFGDLISAERPDIETFGENVGVLSREVFGLDIEQSGFHKVVQQVVATQNSFEAVLKHFDNQLGAEARAVARALLAARQ